MPPDPRLRDTANAILDNLVDALTAAGIDVPERRFVTTGDVAHDFAAQKCAEAFVITWDGNFQGVPGQGAGNLTNAPINCAMPLTAQFTLALLRCVPVVKPSGQAPTAAELQASGEQLMLDAMTLPAVIIEEHLAGDLVPGGCTLLALGQMLPIGPLGGVGGVSVTLIVGLI